MAQLSGPTYIDPPTMPPVPPGIFDVALGPMPFPEVAAQGGGVIYVPDVCVDSVYVYNIQCPAVTGSKTFSAIDAAVSGAPFGVLATYTCSSIGFSFDEADSRVRRRLAMREQRGVEQRLWQGSSGALGTVTGLFRSATNLGAASCPAEAVGLLEQTLADNGVVGGMIHARVGMSTYFAADHIIETVPGSSGRKFSTRLGTPYVFGQGYDGTGPTGQATTSSTEWLYASGRVLLWRDDTVWTPPVGQVMDRSLNTVSLAAERIYAAAVECGVWAVQVTHSCTTAGEG